MMVLIHWYSSLTMHSFIIYVVSAHTPLPRTIQNMTVFMIIKEHVSMEVIPPDMTMQSVFTA
jgi:hypothetical protein